MASINDLGATAEAILNAFATQLELQGVELPKVQYVAPGSMIAWDAPSLTVALETITQGQPGAPFGQTYQIGTVTELSASFGILLIREIPALTSEGSLDDMIPSQFVLDTAGQSILGDAANLVKAAIAIHDKYLITSPGEGFVIGPITPLGPQGGMAGHKLNLEISLS